MDKDVTVLEDALLPFYESLPFKIERGDLTSRINIIKEKIREGDLSDLKDILSEQTIINQAINQTLLKRCTRDIERMKTYLPLMLKVQQRTNETISLLAMMNKCP